MVFGKRQSAPTGMTRDRFVTFLLSVFVGMMLLLTLGGCGSGNGDPGNNNNNNNNNGNGGGDSRLTGRVVNGYNNSAGVSGATVSFGSVSTVTDNSGNFDFVVPSGQAGKLIVVGPANADGSAAYYSGGYIGGAQYQLSSSGYDVTAVASGETRSVGTVIIFSNTGPPLPPAI